MAADGHADWTLSPVQRVWLQEIGIEPRQLRRFAQEVPLVPAEAPSIPRVAPSPGQAEHVAMQAPGGALPSPGQAGQLLVVSPSPESDGLRSVAQILKGGNTVGNGGRADGSAPRVGKAPRREAPVGSMAASTAGVRAPSATPGTMPPLALPPELSALRDEVAVCEACPLYLGRTQTVFGSGAVDAVQWMVIGEAPGGRDDRVGLPFQGRAGELLHAMLRAVGIGLDASVFYTNLVKCQPRGSRNPTPEEIAACRPYLLRQITLLKPHRILALGHLAAQSLLQNPLDLEQLRGQVHWLDVDGATRIPVVATYHPAWLLLRGQAKADAWRDLNLARSV